MKLANKWVIKETTVIRARTLTEDEKRDLHKVLLNIDLNLQISSPWLASAVHVQSDKIIYYTTCLISFRFLFGTGVHEMLWALFFVPKKLCKDKPEEFVIWNMQKGPWMCYSYLVLTRQYLFSSFKRGTVTWNRHSLYFEM